MASSFNSTVGDLINFTPTEWRAGLGRVVSDFAGMIRKIASYHKEWCQMETASTDFSEIEGKFFLKFIFHCNKEEAHGCGTLEDTKNCLQEDNEENILDRSLSKEEQETINLANAYEHLRDIKNHESDKTFHGFIEESMLRETNEIILEGISRQQATKPGVYSKKRRITEFRSETYEYQNPDDMHDSVVKLLDKFNSLYQHAQSESDHEKKLEKLFKTCSWFIFEMLDLHPFGDGNGRLCRLLCSYVLSTCTPFPSPIYNVFCDSSKDDYKQALVDARRSKDRHPCGLTTMIIECNLATWEKFMQEVKKKQHLGKNRMN